MSNFIHGDNLAHKIKIEKDPDNIILLSAIKVEYLKWCLSRFKIIKP